MRDKPRHYDGHNRSNHPQTSMRDLRNRRRRRRVKQWIRNVLSAMRRAA